MLGPEDFWSGFLMGGWIVGWGVYFTTYSRSELKEAFVPDWVMKAFHLPRDDGREDMTPEEVNRNHD